MKTKIFSIISLIFAIILFSYSLTLRILSPSILSFGDAWILLALVFFWFFLRLRKGKIFSKKIRILFWSLFALGLTVSAVNMSFILNPVVNDGSVSTPYVILLGGGMKLDGSLSEIPMERVRSCAAYMKNHPESYAIATGGKVKFQKYDEASVLKENLMKLGVPEENILVEDKARDTIENFKYSLELICQRENVSSEEALNLPITVVTSSSHLARSERLAKMFGFKEVYGIPSRIPAFFLPNVYAREICSYIILFFKKGFLTPEKS